MHCQASRVSWCEYPRVFCLILAGERAYIEMELHEELRQRCIVATGALSSLSTLAIVAVHNVLERVLRIELVHAVPTEGKPNLS